MAVGQVAFWRAVSGWEEPIMDGGQIGGQIVGHRWRYSESLLRKPVWPSSRVTGWRC
jgi:hypothetical protein